MTKEEFKESLGAFFSWRGEGTASIIEAVMMASEPLFEEIKYFHDLNEEIIGMMKEKDRKVKELEKEAIRLTSLLDNSEAKDVKIFQLEKRVKALLDENKEATKKIDELERDISDLSICEECMEEQTRLPENGCYPPMYCHLCMNPKLRKLFGLNVESE